MPISFHNADIKFRVPDGARLKAFIQASVKKEVGKRITLSYVFCSDEFLLDINRKFLNHDFYTDIITFPLTENDGEIEAEIYISIERVKENAGKLKVDFKEELQRVVFHGVLHLLGFGDKSKSKQKAMRAKENDWIKLFASK